MLNKVLLIGNVGKDAEIAQVGDTTVAKFSLATKESWRDKAGNKKEATEWHNIEVWGKQAEAIGKWIEKGRTLSIEGKIVTQSWGEPKKYKTVIRAENVIFIGQKPEAEAGGRGRSNDDGGGRRGRREEPDQDQGNGAELLDEDFPF